MLLPSLRERADTKSYVYKIGTNRRRTFSVGDHRREKREKLPLIAGVRERIVGFYSGPYAFLNHRVCFLFPIPLVLTRPFEKLTVDYAQCSHTRMITMVHIPNLILVL